MPRILIAYDGSDPARAAVRAAGRLFGGAEAVVLLAYDPPPAAERALFVGAVPNEAFQRSFSELEREVTEGARATAEEGRVLAADAGLSATASIVPTKHGVWPEILDAAHGAEADVIVCGARGRRSLGRALLGSTSSGLLHGADLPVMVVHAEEADLAGPVMIAYDGSDAARDAIAKAGSLFRGREAIVAHAWHWPLTDTVTERALLTSRLTEVPEIVQVLKATAEDVARDVAEEGRTLAEEHGLRAEAVLVEVIESVWRQLLAAADEADAGVLIAGSRGRGGIASALLGSVSTALANNAKRPTLVVRPES